MQRRGYLIAQLEDGELSKPELEAQLDVSRSTIDRGIRELESMAMIERTENGFRQTLAGRLALREYAAFTRRIAGLYSGSDLLSTLPRETDFDLAMLQGGTFVEAARNNPHKPAEELYGIVESASAVRGFEPAIDPQQLTTYRERVSDGMELELVLSNAVVERLLSSYAREFESLMAAGRVSIFQAEQSLPYSLTVATRDSGDVAAVTVYTADGGRGCIINDASEAVDWATRRYDVERERAISLG